MCKLANYSLNPCAKVSHKPPDSPSEMGIHWLQYKITNKFHHKWLTYKCPWNYVCVVKSSSHKFPPQRILLWRPSCLSAQQGNWLKQISHSTCSNDTVLRSARGEFPCSQWPPIPYTEITLMKSDSFYIQWNSGSIYSRAFDLLQSLRCWSKIISAVTVA